MEKGHTESFKDEFLFGKKANCKNELNSARAVELNPASDDMWGNF